MGRLLLVRHAQASFLSDNYDQLSPLGETQARLLGEYWARRRSAVDRVCSGPAIRHRHTAQLVGEAYKTSGLDFPETVVAQEFDEFPGDAVLAQALPQLIPKNPTIRQWHEAVQNSPTESSRRSHFQRLFETVISMWIREEVPLEGIETWSDFCARVNRGLSLFLAQQRKGELSAIFTSGGPISIAVQRALHLSAQDTLHIAWMPRNCSFTEFLFSGDRFMLSSFNAFPHLDDESLLTYR